MEYNAFMSTWRLWLFGYSEPWLTRLTRIETKLEHVLKNQEDLMAQIDDLTTAANAVGTIIDQIKTDEDSVLAKLSALQAAGAPNLGPVIAQLQVIHDKAVVADTALSAAGAPTPVVTPVPPVPPAPPVAP